MTNEKTKYKIMQVDYLKIYETLKDSSGKIYNQPFDLGPYLVKCIATNVSLRVINYRGEVARLQHLEKISTELTDKLKKCKNLWKLHFIRMKTNHRTGVASEKGEYSDTLLDEKLNDDQHLAEPTSCLYDADKNLFIMARNRDSVLPSGILDYFIKVTGNINLNLAIIPSKVTFSSNKPKVYRRFCIGIHDVNAISKKDRGYLQKFVPSIYSALNSFKNFGFSNMYIELSMGSMPQNVSMSNAQINSAVLGLLQSEIDNVSKLELKMKENEDTKVETVDLFTNKVHDEFQISYSKKNKITHIRLAKELLDSYNKNINKIR